jgi:hypothetical protein
MSWKRAFIKATFAFGSKLKFTWLYFVKLLLLWCNRGANIHRVLSCRLKTHWAKWAVKWPNWEKWHAKLSAKWDAKWPKCDANWANWAKWNAHWPKWDAKWPKCDANWAKWTGMWSELSYSDFSNISPSDVI